MANGIVLRNDNFPRAQTTGRRPLAAVLLDVLDREISESVGTTNKESLAETLVAAAVKGYIEFPESKARDGTQMPNRKIAIDDANTWLSLVKFIHGHVDGPAISQNDSRNMHHVVRVVYGDSPAFSRAEDDYVEVQ